jgi:hypothetical protein
MSDLRSGSADLASKPLARAVASAFGKPGLLAAAAGLVLSPAAFAATYTVGNTNDNGSSSLRDAIAQANANPGADTITFASNVSGTITLTSGSLHIYDSVDIQGPGAGTLTIAGSAQVPRPSAASYYYYSSNPPTSNIVIGYGGGDDKPAATLATTSVTISGVTITNGHSSLGGGISGYNTILNVNNCVVTGNSAYYAGGGIFIDGYNSTLSVNNSTISNNTAAYGGGVATGSSAITISQSSVTGNYAGRNGGGVYSHTDNYNAQTITASTVSGNSAGNYGGGVFMEHGPASFSNSTFANNSANRGGGLHVHSDDYGTTPLTNSTVSGNSARSYGGGVVAYDATKLVISNTVIGGNSAAGGPDVYSAGSYAVASAFSLVGNTADANITDNGGNLLNVAPQLGALANNGGPTLTMLPLTGSPLINAGDPAFSGLATDQRGTGFPRIVGGRVDIGAVESGTAVVAAATIPAPGLGLGGQLGLGALLGLAGLAVARRKRTLETAAGILLATGLVVSAPHAAQAAQNGHESRHSDATTIASYTVQGKVATIVLGDGRTITAPKWQVRTLDRRSNATHRQVHKLADVTSGTPAAVSYETDKQGQLHHVRIRLTDTLQQAQSLITRKP